MQLYVNKFRFIAKDALGKYPYPICEHGLITPDVAMQSFEDPDLISGLYGKRAAAPLKIWLA